MQTWIWWTRSPPFPLQNNWSNQKTNKTMAAILSHTMHQIYHYWHGKYNTAPSKSNHKSIQIHHVGKKERSLLQNSQSTKHSKQTRNRNKILHLRKIHKYIRHQKLQTNQLASHYVQDVFKHSSTKDDSYTGLPPTMWASQI